MQKKSLSTFEKVNGGVNDLSKNELKEIGGGNGWVTLGGLLWDLYWWESGRNTAACASVASFRTMTR